MLLLEAGYLYSCGVEKNTEFASHVQLATFANGGGGGGVHSTVLGKA